MRTLPRGQRKPANLLWHVLGGECKTCQHPLAGFEIDNTAVPRICHVFSLVWTNSIPRYVMLKVSYKLHKHPKRR
ncbi:MAG: hypothetical protein IJZ31_03905 [Bacteroidaceae bacterium]|nr:hypothetical protein [Bacteroidaceae bacterium]